MTSPPHRAPEIGVTVAKADYRELIRQITQQPSGQYLVTVNNYTVTHVAKVARPQQVGPVPHRKRRGE